MTETSNKPVRKKPIILYTAHRLFSRNGFSNVGVDRIIAESKIAKRTFYNNFSSKENLIISCVDYEISCQKNELLEAVSVNKDNLKAIYQWHIEYVRKPEYNGCLLAKATIELWYLEKVNNLIRGFNAWKFNLINDQLKKLSVKAHEEAATVIFSLLYSITIPANKNYPEWQEFESMIDFFDRS